MIFVYFSLVFFTYVLSILIAVFLEYPFRTMGKVVFSPPKKILRLNRDLARELNTNFVENIFNDDYSDDDDSKRKVENGEYTDDDFNEVDDDDMQQNRKRQKSQVSSQVDLSQYHNTNTRENKDDSMSGGAPMFGGGMGNKMNINQTYTASNISNGNNMKGEDYSDRE